MSINDNPCIWKISVRCIVRKQAISNNGLAKAKKVILSNWNLSVVPFETKTSFDAVIIITSSFVKFFWFRQKNIFSFIKSQWSYLTFMKSNYFRENDLYIKT